MKTLKQLQQQQVEEFEKQFECLVRDADTPMSRKEHQQIVSAFLLSSMALTANVMREETKQNCIEWIGHKDGVEPPEDCYWFNSAVVSKKRLEQDFINN